MGIVGTKKSLPDDNEQSGDRAFQIDPNMSLFSRGEKSMNKFHSKFILSITALVSMLASCEHDGCLSEHEPHTHSLGKLFYLQYGR